MQKQQYTGSLASPQFSLAPGALGRYVPGKAFAVGGDLMLGNECIKEVPHGHLYLEHETLMNRQLF